MKLNRLYTKFLFSFLVVLIIAEFLVLILFVIVPARHFGERLQDFAINKARIVKEIVEEKATSAPGVSWSKNTDLRNFIVDFAKVLDAKVWLTGADGSVAVKSFPGSVPDLSQEVSEGSPRHKDIKVLFRDHFGYYHAVVPFEVAGRPAGNIHALLNKRPFPLPPRKGYFIFGFLVLALTIALLVVPISRLITTRIKRLKKSAIRIAEGDLSHRVRVAGGDEIGELSRAFNGMTDKLESMIRSGKELTANVSHELRSPLTRIRLAEEMLREKLSGTGTQDWVDHLDAIREEVQELDDLIGRMLALSKLNMREAPIMYEHLDPAELIRGLVEKLMPVVEKKGLRLETSTVFDPPFAGDREALRSAFMNILENAVKFAPEKGEVLVLMEWQPHLLEVRVTNTFDRLSEEDLARIFDPFHRAKKAAPATGYGLGLTIARTIIERHGGTISARNVEKGLEVIISLPRGEGR